MAKNIEVFVDGEKLERLNRLVDFNRHDLEIYPPIRRLTLTFDLAAPTSPPSPSPRGPA